MDNMIEIIVAIVAAIGAYFAALANNQAKKANTEAAQANKAVNHTEPGAERLYDIAKNLLTTAQKTHAKVEELDERTGHLSRVILSRPCLQSNSRCEMIDDRKKTEE